MGFWHTGYIEFHETSGLQSEVRSAPLYSCEKCSEIFKSIEHLRQHRFVRHTLRRPVLFVRGSEVGSHPVHIARALDPHEVFVENCERILLNDTEVSLESLPVALSRIANDTCNLRMTKEGIVSEFILEFRVASEGDIAGIERAFDELAIGRRLNARVVSDFIDRTSKFGSAIRYCDGISSYLFGVLLKERSADSQLPFDKYIDKFNSAATQLADYDRRLSRTISGLIAFHFNQFSGVVSIASDSRVGVASSRFIQCLTGVTSNLIRTEGRSAQWEQMITDLQTERIIQQAVTPSKELITKIDEMESILADDPSEFDRPKLHILLGESHLATSNKGEARQHAAALRNIPAFERWAEELIRNCS